MSYYEIVCIIHPALQAGHLEDTIKQINDKIVSSKKGKVLYQENWGKKKLSYLIQKQKYGTYYIFQCQLDGQFINELSSEFQHNTNIIRYLVSTIDENQLMEDKKNNSLIENNSKEEIKQKDKTKSELTENQDTDANQDSTQKAESDDANKKASNTEKVAKDTEESNQIQNTEDTQSEIK